MSADQNDPTRFWEERYRSATTPWDRGGVSPALLAWLDEEELTPCRVLVPGCGRGYEVPELARRGFEVVALDFAPSAVRHLREELRQTRLEAEVLEADVLAWTPDQPFDAIYEQTCLCALPPKTWAQYEQQLWRWLRPGGKLLALFMQTHKEGGPPYHCDPEAMQALFPESRWGRSGAAATRSAKRGVREQPQAPREADVHAAAGAPSRTTLRETEAGAPFCEVPHPAGFYELSTILVRKR